MQIRKDMNKNTNEFYIPEKIILSKKNTWPNKKNTSDFKQNF